MPCEHSATDAPCPKCAETGTPDDKTLASKDPGGLREDLTTGARVGRYIVHDLIGQGGMGLVYTAHDPELDRWVAVKLLRSNPTRTAEGESFGQMRLLREAQAMAQLSHPNVLPVYDVGKFGTSVFVAMELVRGVTLDKWVRAKTHPWRELLDVFIEAGRGLVAAHAAGLVHRDFKPANVLMGEDSRPRLTDFGIARTQRSMDSSTSSGPQETPHSGSSSLDTPLTQAGAMMGSPGYMAPEQYAGVATSPATDQFSFCVSLYEALYGTRPFRGASIVELAHATAMGIVPPPPRGTQVPLWIHKVIEKGLSREPQARHASMQAVLDALSNDPAVKRRRAATIASVAGIVALSLVFGVWAQTHKANACPKSSERLKGVWDPEIQARAEKAFLATGKSYAPLSWDHARTQMDGYAQKWLLARTDACEASYVRGEQTREQMQLRYTCLDRRLEELKALAQELVYADVEVVDQASIAVVRLSSVEDCAQVKSLADRARIPPEAVGAVEQLSQQLAQARALRAAGKYTAARAKVGPAVESAQKLKLPAQQAEADLTLGEIDVSLNDWSGARDALESAARNAEAAGDDPVAARALALMISVVGWRLERPAEGKALAALAGGIVERIGGDPPIEATVLEGLGDAQWQNGERAESLTSYRKALERRVASEGPQSPDVARLHGSIGWVLSEQGAIAEARDELLKSKAIREKVLGGDHPELSNVWGALAQLAVVQGDYVEAALDDSRALPIAEQALGRDSLAVARIQLNVAQWHALNAEPDRALELLRLAQATLDKHPDAARTYTLQALRVHGRIEAVQGHWAEAMKFDRQDMTESLAAYGPDHPETISVAFDVARELEMLGKHREALDLFEKDLAIMDRKGLEHDPEYAAALTDSARVLKAQGHAAEATERLERAVSLLPMGKGNPRRVAAARFALAEVLWAQKGDHTRAKQLAADAHTEYLSASRQAEAEHVAAWIGAHP
jgi:eukaryotic-like serine/threonine-protein kinase